MRWMLVLSLVALLALPSDQQDASEDSSNAEEDDSNAEEEEEEDNASCYTFNRPPPWRKMDPDSHEATGAVRQVLRNLGKHAHHLQYIYHIYRARGEHCSYEEKMTWYKAKYKYRHQMCTYRWTTCGNCYSYNGLEGVPDCT